MKGNVVLGVALALLLTGISIAFNVQPARAVDVTGPIYILDDGSIDPQTAPILQDGDLYTLTDNIKMTSGGTQPHGIVVEKDGITLDGAGYTLEGYAGGGFGVYLSGRRNVIIKNMIPRLFACGFFLGFSSDNTISGNNLYWQSGLYGIWLWESSDNTISGNNMGSSIMFLNSSSNNLIYHNNFVMALQVQSHFNSINTWDDGYPSGGNFWSSYDGTDLNGDGIGDTSYMIDTDNQDRYPLIVPSVWDYSTPIPIVWAGTIYNVLISTNSTVVIFNFNQTARQISFNVTGPSESIGYCNVTIPKQLLSASSDLWVVTVGGVQVTPTVTEDADNAYLYFTYTHSTRTIQITGTDVVPEFSSSITLSISIIFSTLAVISLKRKIFRKPNT